MIFNPTVSGGGSASGTSLELVTGSIPASSAWTQYDFGYLSENQTMEIIKSPAAQQVKVVKGSIFYTNAATELGANKTAVGADELTPVTTIQYSSGKTTVYKFFIANDDFSLS